MIRRACGWWLAAIVALASGQAAQAQETRAAPATLQAPSNLRIEGIPAIPAIPASIVESVGAYTEFRSASFAKKRNRDFELYATVTFLQAYLLN